MRFLVIFFNHTIYIAFPCDKAVMYKIKSMKIYQSVKDTFRYSLLSNGTFLCLKYMSSHNFSLALREFDAKDLLQLQKHEPQGILKHPYDCILIKAEKVKSD